jgi:hypothetical protein
MAGNGFQPPIQRRITCHGLWNWAGPTGRRPTPPEHRNPHQAPPPTPQPVRRSGTPAAGATHAVRAGVRECVSAPPAALSPKPLEERATPAPTGSHCNLSHVLLHCGAAPIDGLPPLRLPQSIPPPPPPAAAAAQQQAQPTACLPFDPARVPPAAATSNRLSVHRPAPGTTWPGCLCCPS